MNRKLLYPENDKENGDSIKQEEELDENGDRIENDENKDDDIDFDDLTKRFEALKKKK